jgi:hypothetical protein
VLNVTDKVTQTVIHASIQGQLVLLVKDMEICNALLVEEEVSMQRVFHVIFVKE